MPETDTRIDSYIKKSADFAKPILQHLRKLIHEACPEVEETMKWSFPHFDYKGSILCSMAAFKQHCAFTFWKASILKDPKNILSLVDRTSMGHMGRITSLDGLPSDKILTNYIKEAAKLNEENIKVPGRKKPAEKKELKIPVELTTALQKNKKAQAAFDSFSYSHKKEYVEWITEAKTDVTRKKRIKTAIEWMAEGKSRHAKYKV